MVAETRSDAKKETYTKRISKAGALTLRPRRGGTRRAIRLTASVAGQVDGQGSVVVSGGDSQQQLATKGEGGEGWQGEAE